MSQPEMIERGPRHGAARLAAHGTLIAFLAFVLMAGSNPVAIRFSNRELAPLWGAASRFALAALVFWAVVAARRIPLPRGRALLGTLLYGVFGVGLAFGLIYWALVRVHPALLSIFLGCVPLATVFLAAAHRLEPLEGRKVAGALLSLGGLALVVAGALGKAVPLVVLPALLAFPFAMAEGAVIVKRFPPAHPVAVNAVSLSVGAAMLAAGSALTGERWTLPTLPATWAAVAYLVAVGTLAVFYLWLFILARWPATQSAYGMVLMPLVTIVMSILLTGEVIAPAFVAGGALALGGVWLGAISRVGRRAPAAPVTPAEPGAGVEL